MTVVPVLWKDVDAPCVRGVLAVSESDFPSGRIDGATVATLVSVLNAKLLAFAPADAPTIRRVSEILLHGTALNFTRSLEALVPQATSPRLVVLTRELLRGSRDFMLTISTLMGTSFTLICDEDATTDDLADMIEFAEGYSVYEQRPIFNGTQHESGRTLANYKVKDKSRLHLLRMRGCSG